MVSQKSFSSRFNLIETGFFGTPHKWKLDTEIVINVLGVSASYEWLFPYLFIYLDFFTPQMNEDSRCFFNPSVPFIYPLKTLKSKGFEMFSGDVEMEHWAKMG